MRLVTLCVNNPSKDQEIHKSNKVAVRCLIKELKSNSKQIENLEKALTSRSPDSTCVTLSAESINKLQIAHRRNKPQVIYCSLWRWPDIKSQHQLRPVCSTDKNPNLTCINPYHYERKLQRDVDPIVLNRQRILPDLSSSFEESGDSGRTKAWPASFSFIDRMNPISDRQAQQHPLSQENHRIVMDAASCNILREVAYGINQQHEQERQQRLHYQQQYQQYSGTRAVLSEVEPSGSNLNSANPNAAGSSQPAPQIQLQYSLQHHQTQYPHPVQQQQQQQYLQTQAEMLASPYQLQAREPFEQFHGHYGQQSSAVQAPRSFIHPDTSQNGINSLPHTQQRMLVPSRVDAKSFQCKQIDGSRDPRYNAGLSGPYPFNMQRMATSSVLAQPSIMSADPGSSVARLATPIHNPFTTNGTISRTDMKITKVADYPSLNTPIVILDSDRPEKSPANGSSQQSANPEDFLPTNQADGMAPNKQQDAENDKARETLNVAYEEDKHWCTLSYHEFETRLGEKHEVRTPQVEIDGFTHSSASSGIPRYSIGAIANGIRNTYTEWVRRRVGKGIRVSYLDGDVYVENLTDATIFVSVPMCEALDPSTLNEDVVIKLSKSNSIKVFSTYEFGKILHCAVDHGFEAVYRLTSRCIVNVSFVKGWGRNYKRQAIYATPCWVEIQLNGPLRWIDKVLRQMRPPPMGCCSTS